jgi:heterotetrameric sarcosine oxidase delta subunit
MFLIDCPYCGPRDQREFKAGGEAHIARPKNPAALTDAEWGDYVFMRNNPKGLFHERWVHIHGCRRWFNVARSTVTDRILKVYGATEPRPAIATDERPATPSGEVAHGTANRPLAD